MVDDVGGGRAPIYNPGVESDRQREAIEALDAKIQGEIDDLRKSLSTDSTQDEIDWLLWMRRFA